MTVYGQHKVLPRFAEGIGCTCKSESGASGDGAVEMRCESTGLGIEEHLVAQRGHHHAGAVAQRVGMGEVAVGCRSKVERDLTGAVDQAHRAAVDYALGEGVAVKSQQ